MSIGERLRLIRSSMSQDEFGKMLGVYKGTVANYEKGARTPDTDHINKILQHFTDINPVWLLTGEGAMRSEKVSELHAEEEHANTSSQKETVDPIKAAFLADWCKLSDIGQMRIWTQLKEELKKERDAD